MFAGERLSPRTRTAALALILLVAALLRLNGLAFGLPALNDPDELMFEMGAVRMLSGPTLDPGWFGHPATTTIYLLAVLNALIFAGGWAVGLWSGPKAFADMIYLDPSWAILPGRVAMVALALWSIWLTWRLAREIAGERVGLAAAALMAVNPVHIAYSQIIRSDIMAVCFMLLVALAALRIARTGQRRDLVLASLWLGLATITKWPFVLSGLAVAGAFAIRIVKGTTRPAEALRGLALFGVLGVAFGLAASPFIVLDYPTLLRNLAGESQLHHLGATGGSPAFNAAWYLSGPMLESLGWGGALAAAWGVVSFVRNREALAIVAPPAVAFFVVICLQRLIWERWALPLMPALSLAAGMGLVSIGKAIASSSRRVGRAAVVVLVAAVLVPSAAQALVDARVRTHDTRQRAAAWVKANVPPGATVLVEHYGFDMLSGPWRFLFPVGNAGCVDVRDMLAGKVQYDQIEEARNQRSNVDYGTLDPARRDTCVSGWAVLTQYDRYRVERGTFPRQYAMYAQLLKQGTIVATFAPIEEQSGGPIVRIVRFATDRPIQAGALPPLRR